MFAKYLRGPLSALPVRPELLRDAGEENAHCREPLLTVHHPDGLHHARHRTGLREGEEGTAVVCPFRSGFCDSHEVIDQPFDIGPIPAISPLPSWNHVLNLSVQQL